MGISSSCFFAELCHMKTKIVKCVLCSCLLLGVFSCDWIEFHPYDTRFDGPRKINAKNVERIEQGCQGRDSLRFAVISDTQRWYDETALAVDDINRRKVDFVLHLGDLTDFGLTREFEWMQRELARLQAPYVCLLGNHDCLGTGPDVFREMYGDPNVSFTAGDTHFVCLNTNAFEYDYSISIPDFAFIKADKSVLPDEVRRTVVAMHAAPGSDQFNNNVAEVFHEKIQEYPSLQFCLSGHNHKTKIFYPLNDGLAYYQCGAASGRNYYLFTFKTDGTFVCEVIDF